LIAISIHSCLISVILGENLIEIFVRFDEMIDLLIYLVRMIGCQLLIWNCLLQSICHCFQFQEGGFSFTFTFLGLIAAINCLFNHLILYFVIVKLLSIINYSTRYLYSPYDYQFTNSIIQHTPKLA